MFSTNTCSPIVPPSELCHTLDPGTATNDMSGSGFPPFRLLPVPSSQGDSAAGHYGTSTALRGFRLSPCLDVYLVKCLRGIWRVRESLDSHRRPRGLQTRRASPENPPPVWLALLLQSCLLPALQRPQPHCLPLQPGSGGDGESQWELRRGA